MNPNHDSQLHNNINALITTEEKRDMKYEHMMIHEYHHTDVLSNNNTSCPQVAPEKLGNTRTFSDRECKIEVMHMHTVNGKSSGKSTGKATVKVSLTLFNAFG